MTSKRAAILEAAAHLFSTRGFRETSTTDIARLTDVAEGTIFYHFGNKEKLFLAVLANVENEIESAFVDFLETVNSCTGMEMLCEVASFYVRLAGENVQQFMLLHRHHAYELAGVNEDCRRHLETIYDRFFEVIELALKRGRQDGSMTEEPSHKTAMLLYLMIDGLVRFQTYNLYQAGSLFPDLLEACRRLVGGREVATS